DPLLCPARPGAGGRRRPLGAIGARPDAGRTGRRRAGRRGLRRRRGVEGRPAGTPGRRAHGHPDARHERAGRHQGDAAAPPRAVGDRDDDVQRRRLRRGGGGRGRGRLPGQGHARAGDRERRPPGRRRRGHAVAVGDPRGARADATGSSPGPVDARRGEAGDPDPTRAGGRHLRRSRTEQRRHRRGALPLGAHRQGARLAALRQARIHEPGPDRDGRPRRRARL
ncbi:MAG: Two-component transcriptional response regulator, LuxR family, partial [uncultured Nocardioides sp.]